MDPEPDPDPMKRKFLDPNPIGSVSGSYPTVSTVDTTVEDYEKFSSVKV